MKAYQVEIHKLLPLKQPKYYREFRRLSNGKKKLVKKKLKEKKTPLSSKNIVFLDQVFLLDDPKKINEKTLLRILQQYFLNPKKFTRRSHFPCGPIKILQFEKRNHHDYSLEIAYHIIEQKKERYLKILDKKEVKIYIKKKIDFKFRELDSDQVIYLNNEQEPLKHITHKKSCIRNLSKKILDLD